MNDDQQLPSIVQTQTAGTEWTVPSESQRNYMYITYGVFIIAFFVPFLALVGVILAYLKRDEMKGTIYYDHMRFLIRTFWGALIAGVVSAVLVLIAIGILLLWLVGIWYVIRVVIGAVKMFDNKPVNPESWLI